MKLEPVAWMLTLPDGTHDWILDGRDCEGYVPLYTAAQIRKLKDIEILVIYKEAYRNCLMGIEPHEFVKSILRKAHDD